MTQAQKQRLLRHLQQLISMSTTPNNPDVLTDCLAYIQQFALEHGWHCKSIDGQSLIVSAKPGKKFTYMLQAHLDVVPGDSAQFRVVKQQGRFYGRGTYDMKFAAACYLELMATLNKNTSDVCFAFTTDEETSGHGSAKLVQLGYSADVVVLPDGGQDWQMERAAKGGWAAELTIHGTPAHGSRPWEGKNPVETLLKLLPKIVKLNQNKAGKTTVVVSMLHAGEASNQVPATARATLDCRFVDLKAYAKLRKKVESLASKAQATLETAFFVEPLINDLHGQYHAQFAESVSAITKLSKLTGAQSLGASDARFYAAAGMPVILTRPPGGGAHSDSEWISQKGFFQFYQVLERFLTQQVK